MDSGSRSETSPEYSQSRLIDQASMHRCNMASTISLSPLASLELPLPRRSKEVTYG